MTEAVQFVAFRVGSQQFAVEIHSVVEVIGYCEITPLPGTSRFVEGIIDVRGTVLPVIDMRKRLGNTMIQNTMQTRILILRINRQKIGLIVDETDQVHRVPVENIQAPPEQGSDFILAIARHEDSLFLVLDLQRVLTGDEATHLLSITDGKSQRGLQA